jgi:hypothetical protein
LRQERLDGVAEGEAVGGCKINFANKEVAAAVLVDP